MSTFPFPLGMNQFTTQPWSFEEDIRRFPSLSVQTIELCEAKMDLNRLDEQMRLVRESGLKVSSVQPLVRTFYGSQMVSEPQDPAQRLRRLEHTMRTLAPYTQGAPFVVNTGAPPQGNVQECLNGTIKALKSLCPLAEELGITLSLEPLNPTSINSETGIWTINQALEIIDTVGHPALGLCLDYWNIWQQPQAAETIRAAGSRINVVQISDWRTPRSAGDRLIPGDGDIPLRSLLQATWDAGFRGACAVEIFSSDVEDSLYLEDPADVIKRSYQGLKKLWNDA
ncbi:TIM barrel protein [Saccharibacter sp. 17.LH.SD]|uniref:sugar phosphate isomerase/epimerase family protein n=1 Tax=Saccharibacter sp. 17.LH.SD TaxID=2689393 RepID=UPI00137188F7|nr:sugar phosphate isomerase/epimerase family protein [Saccharibacter sp. 17.LH.SD]MXV43769.1 TIM barrel protein [Saccharibacter sp. 17.LH.SD]